MGVLAKMNGVDQVVSRFDARVDKETFESF
jgi:hypothetical protein